MGNFEKLSVVVIVVIIVMILVVALNTWTERPEAASSTDAHAIDQIQPFPPEPELVPDDKLLRDNPFPDPLPITPVPTPEPVKAEPRTYIVRGGDTLGGIAERELGSIKHVVALRELNPTLSEVLRIGDTIQLPAVDALKPDGGLPTNDAPLPADAKPGGVYVTKKGDTWDRISRLVYKTKDRWHVIFAMNSDIHQNVNTPLPEGSRIQLPK